MNEFDSRARDWDKDKMHIDRSQAIASALVNMIPINPTMKALEYGAGTGLLSFILRNRLGFISMMDSSQEMVKVTNEKIATERAGNLEAINIDLENEDYAGSFDIIFNQMVLHHVFNIDLILRKFYSMLNIGGYLAIADLHKEDGSFHGPNFNGHKGFDVQELRSNMKMIGFSNIRHENCFTISRPDESDIIRHYPIFLLVASK